MAKQVSAKQKMLNFLNKKSGQNTFTVTQGRNLFKIANVTARICELRQEGHKINLVEKKTRAGVTSVYQLAA